MSEFSRFPGIPHLAWLGEGIPRSDKLLSTSEAQKLLAGTVVVEEKVDGANVGISLNPQGVLQAQNRGQYLTAPFRGQFGRLDEWMFKHQGALFEILREDLIIFGEWCAARHSLAYDKLPDWFLVIDVYDRHAQRFWSTRRRDALALQLNLCPVPILLTGRTSSADLITMTNSTVSRFRRGPLEGIVVRAESAHWLSMRAKVVRAEFVGSISSHWRSRLLEWNGLDALIRPGQ